MSNEDRRTRASEALVAAYPGEPGDDYRISDLIADLLHLAEDATTAVDRAVMHYEAEREEDR